MDAKEMLEQMIADEAEKRAKDKLALVVQELADLKDKACALYELFATQTAQNEPCESESVVNGESVESCESENVEVVNNEAVIAP